jgi:hypothetical protein
LSSLTGYTGNYTVAGNYNTLQYYSGNSTTTSFIYYTGSYWCLSNSLGGSCVLQGATPCKSVCPDISANDFTIGVCPSPTPLPVDCTTFDFNAYFDCDWEPTPTPIPIIPCGDVDFDFTNNTVTPTPPTPVDLCENTAILFSLSGYTPVGPTVTSTPTQMPTPDIPVGGQVTFNMLNEVFSCVSVKVLKLCGTNTEIYTNDSLTYLGIPITTGTTFLALMSYPNGNNVQECVTYVRDDFNFSSDSTIAAIYNVYGNCGSCSVLTTQTPTPTVTPTLTTTQTQTPTQTLTRTPTNTPTQTLTQTPTRTPGGTPASTPAGTLTQTPTNTRTQTPTPTLTKTPTPTPNYYYVFQSCQPVSPQTVKSMVGQSLPHGLLVVGQVIKDSSNVCWEYLGRYETNYAYPSNVIWSTFQGDKFSNITTTFSNCAACSTPPAIPCNGSLTTTGEAGYYEIINNIGSNTGNVTITFNALSVPDRFQIYWNNTLVADSLFVGDDLNTNSPTRTTYVNEILNASTLTKYIYVGTGGNAVFNGIPNFAWSTNGTISVSYTNADIAPNTSTRASGSVGNQIGVVANIPSPSAKSSDGDVKLTFNKTLAEPGTIRIVAIGVNGGTGWRITNLTCPPPL